MNFLRQIGKKAQNFLKSDNLKSTTQTNQFYQKVSTKNVKQTIEDYQKEIEDDGFQVVEKVDGLDRVIVSQQDGLILMTAIKGYQTQSTLTDIPEDVIDSCEIVSSLDSDLDRSAFSLTSKLHYAIVNKLPVRVSHIYNVIPSYDTSHMPIVDEQNYEELITGSFDNTKTSAKRSENLEDIIIEIERDPNQPQKNKSQDRASDANKGTGAKYRQYKPKAP